MKYSSITSIIFDWGGVLIENPAPGLVREMAGFFGISEDAYLKAFEPYEDDFTRGRINEPEIWQKVATDLERPLPDEGILWRKAFASVYKKQEAIFSLAFSLQKAGYKTGFLSNTEIPAMAFFLEQQYRMFDACCFSCAENLRKPEKKIYERILSFLDCPAESSLFIDDKFSFVMGAESAGMKGICFHSYAQLISDMKDLDIRF